MTTKLLLHPKPERLPERKAVTIVAGFKCPEGIVLCADTQETVGASKRNIPKLRFEPNEKSKTGVPADELAVGFCGAGNNGVFMDEMVDRAWEDVQTSTSLDEACNLINSSIKQYHREAVHTYQNGCCPEVELIYGVKMHGKSRLFYALGPAIAERDKYATGGQGLYLADFLASRMYAGYLGLRQCVILAAYTLFEAKENVDGCGGDSHIAILRDGGLSGRVDWRRIETLTTFLKLADRYSGQIMLHAADLHSDDQQFKHAVTVVIQMLGHLRKSQMAKLEHDLNRLGAFYGESDQDKEDEYGFPKPSTSQT